MRSDNARSLSSEELMVVPTINEDYVALRSLGDEAVNLLDVELSVGRGAGAARNMRLSTAEVEE
ncbi:hypothetical protein [Rhizobium leguminosarum]|uniref:hypothetical protein n=1 Tax=Rhizobium leguminosarum TaxID=384 RepID=UPI0012FCB3A0|nr:hypothetical protein [Rhizobium leguminosarum]MVO94386.1 hypothetical protein [Rhizobium leguminosarum bv. phaseoli]